MTHRLKTYTANAVGHGSAEKREKEKSAEVGRHTEWRRWLVGNNRPGNIRHGLGLLYDTLRFPVRLRPRLASSWHARGDRWCAVVAGVAPCDRAAFRIAFAYCAVARPRTIRVAARRAFSRVDDVATAQVRRRCRLAW